MFLALDFPNEDGSLTLDEILFHILGPTKEVFSVPYLTIRTLRDLNLVSFLSKYGFSAIRKIFADYNYES